MTHKECWNNISDARWLMYLIKNSSDLKKDYELSNAMWKFALITAEEVYNLTGKESELFRSAHDIAAEHMVTGNMGGVIAEKRLRYLDFARKQPLKIKDALEYNTYLALIDEREHRAAYKVYENAVKVVRRLAGKNTEIKDFFKFRLADKFRNLTEGFEPDEAMECEKADVIAVLDQYEIYPNDGGYKEVCPENKELKGADTDKYYEMWLTEESMRLMAYMLVSSGKYDETKARQFALDTLKSILHDSGFKYLLDFFGDMISLVQDTIHGIKSRTETAETAYKDNAIPYMAFCGFKRMIYAALNAMKYEDTDEAIIYAFTFMESALNSSSAKEKELWDRIKSETADRIRYGFDNPFGNPEHRVPVEFDALKCLRENGYAPFVRRGKWGYRKEYQQN